MAVAATSRSYIGSNAGYGAGVAAAAGDAELDGLCRKDLECSICLELLLQPQRLPCSHAFCRSCLAAAVRRDRHCALCRAAIPEDFNPALAPVHKPLEDILVRACTVEYTQRLEEVARAASQLVRLHIGNKYDLLGFKPRITHRWTVHVELAVQEEAALPAGTQLPDLIKHVRFGLLPACRLVSCGSQPVADEERDKPAPSFVEVRHPPFEVTCTSWCSCTVPVVVSWQDWVGQPPLRLDHVLNFQCGGGSWDYGVDLRAALTGGCFQLAEQDGIDVQVLDVTTDNVVGRGGRLQMPWPLKGKMWDQVRKHLPGPRGFVQRSRSHQGSR